MAHNIRIGELTDELITVVTGLSLKTDARAFALCKEPTLKGLKSHNFGRTNQFDVSHRLQGLEEKFRVLNNEDLADTLRRSLNELSNVSSKWAPEILSLCLELSDKPAVNSRIQDLEFLQPPDPPLPLTLAEIIADDPLDGDEIPYQRTHSDESSEEEHTDDGQDSSITTAETQTSTILEEGEAAYAQAFVVPTLDKELQGITNSQFWIKKMNAVAEEHGLSLSASGEQGTRIVTELQAVRETIFMLLGLPTSLYVIDEITGTINPDRRYTLRHSSEDAFGKILKSFTSVGQKLSELRSWIAKPQTVPLLQTFKAAIEKRMRASTMVLSAIQCRSVASESEEIVSLLRTDTEIQGGLQSLLQLADLVWEIDSTSESQAFRCLELLFDHTCLFQMVGNQAGYEYMAALFFECLGSYIRPIRIWMEQGELSKDNEDFFICTTNNNLQPKSLWHDQFTIRQSASGKLHVPSFLHAATKMIFTTGKSVVFLKRLGFHDRNTIASTLDEPKLDYHTVCEATAEAALAPFSELFDLAFDRWINSKHHSASLILRERLYSQCGLWRSLDALEHIYFLKDGALIGIITSTIFEKIDKGKEAWNDRFLLTELARSVFGNLNCVDAEKLIIRSSAGEYRDVQSRRRSVKILNSISIDYVLPWPIMNIIKKESLIVHQHIFTFLLQVRRAKQILERQRLLKENVSIVDNDDGEIDAAYLLRHRLLWFANTIYSYVTETVIMPSTSTMLQQMANAKDIDAMVAVHEAFCLRLEDQCLLSKKLAPIRQSIRFLLDLAIFFSDAHSAYTGERLFDTTNRSMTSHNRLLPWRRKYHRNEDDDISSSDEEDDEGRDADISYISFQETAYADRLQNMKEQFNRLSNFVIAGLRSISRAGGEPCWEMLAEKLVWGREHD
ncbi:MAG: hypothetical protein M1827_000402 [Pycnora praestabilis]|nr:MAG: hypothetical protein M1827_000402 [Pycnora praestabilis]